MERRAFIATGVALLGAPLIAAPTAGKVARIGWLQGGSPASTGAYLEAFRRGLRDAGYSERENISIESRYARGSQDQLHALAAELVRLKVDVIVVDGTETAIAAKAVTTSVPIVFVLAGDPVGSRLVATLAQPRGNLTGLSNLTADLSAKQLQLLKEAFPQISHVGVFFNPSNPATAVMLDTARVAALALAVELQLLEVRNAQELTAAFRILTDGRAGAVLVLADPIFRTQQGELLRMVAERRLPGMYPDRQYVEAQALMSYGPSFPGNFYRAAAYVDKILKGAKPGDLPVEQPTKFELVINLKTARALGLTIPPSLLLRADQVIE